ncbi:MAG: DUF4392 domain-containing protein [Candidatus Rokubacteria bacterium]|nr:DUF4392 domain-containing protein [Candidatus Rokubacteria bacterium]
MPARFDPIDHVLALDLGARGIASFFTPGAAAAAAAALRGARRVLVATGFTVAADTPETDGPPGAAALGRALRLTGAQVRYVTDAHNVPILEAALKTHDEPVDVLVYPDGDGHGPAWLARERPTHLVAIERPGRAPSGEYLNLRGVPITAWNRRIDELFLFTSGGALRGSSPTPPIGSNRSGLRRQSRRSVAAAKPALERRSGRRRRPVTVGVGDGGNEIGMGNVRARLVRQRSPLAPIASTVRVDHLVVAGTSNWGAYGVAAALARLTGRDLLHHPDTEVRVIEACVAAGAFDGVTRKRLATVDGLAVDVHAAVVELLRAAAAAPPRR